MSAVDPFINNVVLLMHMDGADGSSVFKDETYLSTITATGAVRIRTAQRRFGTASAYFPNDGAWNYLNLPGGPLWELFYAGDFTVEAWVNTDVAFASGNRRIFAIGGGYEGWNSTNGIHFLLAAGPDFAVRAELSNGSAALLAAGGALPAPGVWAHVAAALQGDVLRVFLDGELVGSRDVATRRKPSAVPWGHIGVIPGAGSTGSLFRGYIDELRVTKGVARYTANFTPPSEPFPDPYIPPEQAATTTYAPLLQTQAFTYTRSAQQCNSDAPLAQALTSVGAQPLMAPHIPGELYRP